MAFNNAAQVMQMQARIERQIAASLSAVATLARNHYVESFRNQGFTDEWLNKWTPRKARDRGRQSRGSRAILVRSGSLRNSIKARVVGYTIIISSDLPYANIHNDGGQGARRMPKRQFVGYSAVLNSKIKGMIDRRITRTFNGR